MKLTCYAMHGEPPLLRAAPATRDWMDGTPQAYAYRCLPLNIANAHGWEILCRTGFTAHWDGGASKDAIVITPDPGTVAPAISHFGSGVLTFHIEAVFRTEPGWSLYAQGPVNAPKDGIAPLTGIIETDWAPYSFTMNWKFTALGRVARFDAGEPFCAIFPIQRRLLESVEPEIRSLKDDPELEQRFQEWSTGRLRFNADLAQPGSAAQAEKWQKSYYLGLNPDGSPADPDHLIKLRPPGFVDKRGT
ncbi:DUF6065 family protein [Niveispirillum cyanobacteriorum]|uniref:Uncharacterized protein n=1 Tax=Niveispirillum cyanobacteriorum TaxID=1612173 RepID=A0A2K9NIK7_9PROT|nr:DUF6065 family protein [Niveispirillum cyanobacteriorum]AUN32937.1 hypothetical protein C0V82_21175 [Niveispirillum cyanobacteriorum]GGE46918.1 hypothetical protein GCM10011317_01620 [Niveispirillum cyanobacteriorum]